MKRELLKTVVTVIMILMSLCWISLSIAAVILVVRPASFAILFGSSSLRVSIITLGTSFCGLLTTLILLAGLHSRIPFLFLPWLIVNSLISLGLFAVGTYSVIFFLTVKTRKNNTLAALSTILIIISFILSSIIVVVCRLFLQMRQKQLLVRVASSFRGSRASLNYKSKNLSNGTPRSVRSVRSCDKDTILNGMVMRYNTSAVNSAPTSRKFKEARIHENNKYTSPYHIPKTRVKKTHKMHKSRSHEHILDSSTDESMYRERQSQSLPRGRRKTPDVSAKNLGTQGAWSNYSIHKNSDIIQSNGSIKSVSIHPKVVEYHFMDNMQRANSEEKPNQEFPDNGRRSGHVPPPIFPRQKSPSTEDIVDPYYDFVL